VSVGTLPAVGHGVALGVNGNVPSAPSLRRSPWERRALRSTALTAGAWVAAVIASVPLVSVLYMLIVRGGARLHWDVLVELPPAGFEMGGGFGNAIVGTLVMVGLAAIISVPVGIVAAVFLAELGPYSSLASTVRFSAKTMTGLPSILAGVFAYASVVLVTGTYSAPAGAVALAVLMVPTVVLTAEEAMKMVPRTTRDAAYGMGCTRSQVIWKIVLPTALPGILTGVMLSIARAAGETAPLLFTALFSSYWLFEQGAVRLMQPTASLAVLIYNFSGMPFENQIELAWAASLVLVAIVLVVSIISRWLSGRAVVIAMMIELLVTIVGRLRGRRV
jgi:phosphate transport system permease protein